MVKFEGWRGSAEERKRLLSFRSFARLLEEPRTRLDSSCEPGEKRETQKRRGRAKKRLIEREKKKRGGRKRHKKNSQHLISLLTSTFYVSFSSSPLFSPRGPSFMVSAIKGVLIEW